MCAKIVAENIMALTVGGANVSKTFLFEISLKFASEVCAEKDLIGTTGKNISRDSLSVFFKSQMEESDLVLEALGAERNILKLLELFFESTGYDFAWHPIKRLVDVFVKG